MNMITKLEEARIFKIVRPPFQEYDNEVIQSAIIIEENCDNHYFLPMSQSDLLDLAEELIELANTIGEDYE